MTNNEIVKINNNLPELIWLSQSKDIQKMINDGYLLNEVWDYWDYLAYRYEFVEIKTFDNETYQIWRKKYDALLQAMNEKWFIEIESRIIKTTNIKTAIKTADIIKFSKLTTPLNEKQKENLKKLSELKIWQTSQEFKEKVKKKIRESKIKQRLELIKEITKIEIFLWFEETTQDKIDKINKFETNKQFLQLWDYQVTLDEFNEFIKWKKNNAFIKTNINKKE